ncbi:hypothetical protein MMC25_005428 [Agyrium rufum]|nr:hypothetical protein [Agyrium rufum]
MNDTRLVPNGVSDDALLHMEDSRSQNSGSEGLLAVVPNHHVEKLQQPFTNSYHPHQLQNQQLRPAAKWCTWFSAFSRTIPLFHRHFVKSVSFPINRNDALYLRSNAEDFTFSRYFGAGYWLAEWGRKREIVPEFLWLRVRWDDDSDDGEDDDSDDGEEYGGDDDDSSDNERMVHEEDGATTQKRRSISNLTRSRKSIFPSFDLIPHNDNPLLLEGWFSSNIYHELKNDMAQFLAPLERNCSSLIASGSTPTITAVARRAAKRKGPKLKKGGDPPVIKLRDEDDKVGLLLFVLAHGRYRVRRPFPGYGGSGGAAGDSTDQDSDKASFEWILVDGRLECEFSISTNHMNSQVQTPLTSSSPVMRAKPAIKTKANVNPDPDPDPVSKSPAHERAAASSARIAVPLPPQPHHPLQLQAPIALIPSKFDEASIGRRRSRRTQHLDPIGWVSGKEEEEGIMRELAL